MKVKEDVGFCTCCNNYGEYNFGDENYSLIIKDLDNYKKYKDFYVYKCPRCNFVSTDITGTDGVIAGGVLNTLEYKNALSYADFEGLDKELYDCHSSEIPANLYESYAYVCLRTKDYEKFLRTIFQTIELKTYMALKYRHSQDELAGEEENDDLYDLLDTKIKQSIETNRKQFDFYYTQLERTNVFLDLMNIENLIGQNKKEDANTEFLKIKKEYPLKDDLLEYFNELFSK